MQRLQVRFVGRVQGVGFRYRTRQIASRFAVTGLVRNEDDGSVRMIAEGDRQVLIEFLQAIKNDFLANIQSQQTNWSEASREWDSFEIDR